MAGRILTRVNPICPPEAGEAHISGTVVLQARIGEDGAIRDLAVVSGPQNCSSPRSMPCNQWIYQPLLLHGAPTEVSTTIRVNYALQP